MCATALWSCVILLLAVLKQFDCNWSVGGVLHWHQLLAEEVSISLLSLEFCCVFGLLIHRTEGLPLAQPVTANGDNFKKPSFLLLSCYLNYLLSHWVSLAISLLVSWLLIFLLRVGEDEGLWLLVRDMKGLVLNSQLSVLLLLSADFGLGQVEHGQSAHRNLSVLLCSALHIPSLLFF